MILPKEHKTLFSLLRITLWQNRKEESPDYNLTTEEWQSLIDSAARQGVLAITLDALPKGMEIPGLTKELKVRWGLSVLRIEDRNRRQREVLKELILLFKKQGIELLLLKGLGLSENYPQPNHRECGDLDIYLFGDYEKGNQIIENRGIEVNRESAKHSTFFYKGIPVENHQSFLDVASSKNNDNLEAHLIGIIKEQGYNTFLIDEIEIRIPTPDFTAIFLTRHDITHFLGSGLVIRHLCDLSLFFTKNVGHINFQLFLEILAKESQLKLFCSFMDLAQQHLGMSTSFLQGLSSDKRISERVFQDTMHNIYRERGIEELISMWVLKRKAIGAVHLFRSKWKYDLMGKGLFYQRLIFSLKKALNLK